MIKKYTLTFLFAVLLITPLGWAEDPASSTPIEPSDSAAAVVATVDENTQAQTPQAVPAVPEMFIKIGALAKFDKLNGICSTWNIGCPTAGDTVIADEGGLRSALAKKHIGFIGLNMTGFGYNFAQAPKSPQVFNYQKPNWVSATDIWLTYNLPKNMQFIFGGSYMVSNYIGQNGPNAFKPMNAYLTQKLMNGRLQYIIGYGTNDTTVYGGYIAGNLATGTMGVNAVIPYELGMAFTPFSAPTASIKYTFKNNLYFIAAVQRANDPKGNYIGMKRDPVGFRFCPKGCGALYMPEIGYKRAAAPGVKSIWFRTTGWYNSTGTTDYSSVESVLSGKKVKNAAVSIDYEAQITQPDKMLPFRGIYWTALGQWAAPEASVYHQYYQVALYSIGLFRSRPMDIMILNVNRTQFSRTALNTFEKLPAVAGVQMGVPTFDDSTSVSATYGLHVRRGTVLSMLLSRSKHPTFAPRFAAPVTGAVSLMFYL